MEGRTEEDLRKLINYTLDDLKSATRNFRPDTVLGEGGFGRVFKGWIDSNTFKPSRVGVGIPVAVKKSNPDSLQGHLYVKSDVYGFGVVLLELLTGRAALDTTLPTDMQNLVQCSMSSLNDKKRLQKIMDPKLDYRYSPRAAFHIAQVIIKCLESDHRKRPSMVDVLATLEKAQSMKYRPKGNKASAIRQTSDVHHPNYPRSSPSPLHYKNND
ncbi:hypothetical protein V8G54_008718 [Vigna mungo]|uniref:Protein kinase domain-containing protein n=1 Tax=Vigna mungo TaxID=3915 RepID=A0AAQ3P5P5_VIGMU